MTVSKKKIIEALKQVLPGVDMGKTLLEGADTFIFADGFLYSYNDNVSVRVPLSDEGLAEENLNGAVKAKEFYGLVSKLPGDEIKIAAKDAAWVLKAGNAKVELTLLDSAVMDRIKGISPGEEFKPLPANFLDALHVCKFGCNRSSLSGIFVKGAIMAATDEWKVNWFNLDAEMESFWISDPAAGELMKITGLSGYYFAETWAHFRSADGAVFSCKRLKHDSWPFAKLAARITECEKDKGDFSQELPEGLTAAAERAGILSMSSNDDRDAIDLTFSKEGILVESKRATGKYKELVPWDKPMETEFSPVSILVDPAMIGYGISRSKAFHIKEVKKGNAVSHRMIFTGPSVTLLVATFQRGAE